MNDPFKEPSPPEMFQPMFAREITDDMVARAAQIIVAVFGSEATNEDDVARRILVAALRS